MEYSGLNYYEALELPCDLFQLMVKNSIIDELQQTKEGRQYLDDCKRLEATEPDMGSLQQLLQKGVVTGGI